MDEKPQTRKGIQKLYSPPVKIKVYLSYKPGKTEQDDITPIEEESAEAWLHPLTAQEWSDCEAVSVEGYRHFKEKGGDDKDANWKGQQLFSYQQVLFCVKVSGEEGADRLFKDELEVMQLHRREVNRIIMEYTNAFVPSREEIKNSLRERLGLGSGTPSTSPATSGTPGSSSLKVIGKKTRTMSRR